MVIRYIGDRFAWLSSDDRPTDVTNGAYAVELDTGLRYYYYQDHWNIITNK